ncbi:unnamed protein product [Lepeophtheirus salmonis]|uniref:(salmon louse) hypothetical protein n=1 Tax=Lepeophtheirus salmonis TaxID=72036 RepID=A0A7R8CY04_LEPSM|nr:unnamed protein product [Lepeophtheirus salmonis]CAF2937573.1 unnamed protein product [Lepeophtheirus salmonis]
MTARWPLAIFHIIIDVSSYNAFLGKALVAPLIERRKHVPRTEASAQILKAFQSAGLPERPDDQASTFTFKASKRKKCQFCPKEQDNKTIIHVLNAINTYAKVVPYHTVHHVLNR